MKNILTSILSMLSIVLTITGCGFHLRGTSGGPNDKLPYKTVYIDCGNVAICTNLTSAIKTQDLAVIESYPESAEATIKLVREDTSRDAQGFTSVGRVSSYLLTYRVTAQVIQKHEQIGHDIIVSSQSTMQYNDSTILSGNQNEVTFWDQLHEAATNQLVIRLIFFKNQLNTSSSGRYGQQ